jgi:hypothetical protein
MVLAPSVKVCPEHTGELPVIEGATGSGVTVTEVSPAGPVQLFAVAVTEYVPAPSEEIPAMVGFCKVEVKLLGPVHE